MIRQIILIQIKKTIDSDEHFSSSDFKFLSDYNQLKIIYEYDDSYALQIEIPREISKLKETQTETSIFGTKHKDYSYEEYEFSGIMKPGEISLEEKIKFEGQNNIYTYLKIWLANLWKEITIQPELRKMEQVQEELEEIRSKFDNLSEDFFTKEEADSLKDRLDILERNFKEKLEIEIADKELLIQTLGDLHKELEKLKGQTTFLNKKSWFKSFGIKLFSWITKEENRKFLKDTKEIIKPLLPESIDKLV